MHNRLVILGAGGHGKVIADIALKNGYREIIFLDDNLRGACMGIPILGATWEAERFDDGMTDFIVAIGDNLMRERIAQRHRVNWVTLVHPSAQLGADVQLGCGCVVMAGGIVNSGSTIGDFCIINTAASVDHDCVVGEFSHISVGSHLAGTVSIGRHNWIGIGAVVSNNIHITDDCIIGAGAVVVSDVKQAGIYKGVPARLDEDSRKPPERKQTP